MKKIIRVAIILCLVFSMVACGTSRTGDKNSPSPNNTNISGNNTGNNTNNNGTGNNADNNGTGITTTETLKIGKADYAAHGTKGFCVAVAVVQGDTIVQAIVDDYQVMSKADAICVPNSDSDFGNYFADTKSSLASKRTNTDYYSGLMKSSANATIPINKSYDAIADYAIGKTVKELEDICGQKNSDELVDAVSGSTLADTKGYLLAIVEAAKNAVGGDNTQDNSEIMDDTNGNNNPSGVDKNNSDLSNGTPSNNANDNGNVTASPNNNGKATASPSADTNGTTGNGTGNTTGR